MNISQISAEKRLLKSMEQHARTLEQCARYFGSERKLSCLRKAEIIRSEARQFSRQREKTNIQRRFNSL